MQTGKRIPFCFWWVQVISFCGPLPSDHRHGYTQPCPRCAHVCWNANFFSRNHFQHSVRIRRWLRWMIVIHISVSFFATHAFGLPRWLPLSRRRCFPAEDRGCDSQVFNTHNSFAMGFLCVGLHLFLDFCHVYVLPSGTLQKVCPPAPFLMLSTHDIKEAANALERRHSAELCLFFPNASISSLRIIECKQTTPPRPEAIYSSSEQSFSL